MCELTDAATGEAFWYDPRRELAGVAERFKGLNLRPVLALEPEF